MIYIKTIISSENEVKYIKLNLRESYGYVDKIIVCEYNYTHTGKPRELFFGNKLSNGEFSGEELNRIQYIPGEVDDEIIHDCTTGEEMHKNETLFRGFFVKKCNLNRNDIIISLDADEVIFRRSYETILRRFRHKWNNPVIALKLYQFFYLPTYLWVDNEFSSPIICRVKIFEDRYPSNWRDVGRVTKDFVGCHFSWLLTVDEMMIKLHSYAHAIDYEHVNKEMMYSAIKEKTYPFDLDRSFKIKEVNFFSNPEYYPDTFEMSEFLYLYER